MSWNIKPQESIGPIRFGMSKEEIINILGENYEVFKRTNSSADTFAFDTEFVYIGMDERNCVEHISVFKPQKVQLSGVQLIGRIIEELGLELSKANLDFIPLMVGFGMKNTEL